MLGVPKPKSELTFGEVMELYLENLKPNVKSATYYTATHEIKSAFKYIPSSVLFADIATNDLTRLAQVRGPLVSGNAILISLLMT